MDEWAHMVKRESKTSLDSRGNLSSVAIYSNDNLKSSEETKALVQKIVLSKEMTLHFRDVGITKKRRRNCQY